MTGVFAVVVEFVRPLWPITPLHWVIVCVAVCVPPLVGGFRRRGRGEVRDD